MSLRDEALARAMKHSSSSSTTTTVNSNPNPNLDPASSSHPLLETLSLTTTTMTGTRAPSSQIPHHPSQSSGESTAPPTQEQSSTISTAKNARSQWKQHGQDLSQTLENRRLSLQNNTKNDTISNNMNNNTQSISSIRVISAEDRVDPAGSYYTAYIFRVKLSNTPEPLIVEHRYSEFRKLHSELTANHVHMRSSFPTKSLCGRIGNWTPAARFAPEKMTELITYRRIKLDIWMVELAELLAREDGRNGNGGGGGGSRRGTGLHGEMRDMCMEFFCRSAAGCPPCDRANTVSWDGLGEGDIDDGGVGEKESKSETTDNSFSIQYRNSSKIPTNNHSTSSHPRHASGTEKHLPNPLSFTLGSEIRKATYTVGHMCGSSALAADRSIPLDLLHQAKGLCFLTVVKVGCVVSGRVGTGLMIARTKDGGWSPPSAIGTIGMGYGALIGGDITSYLIILNTSRAVTTFASQGSVNLGAEAGVSVGPLGRSATGNVNAGGGGIAPAYSYAHSKGFFAGISLEGSVVGCRNDVNAKFYGRPVDVNMLLFDNNGWRPRACQPLYDALEEALGKEIVGFRPSQMLDNQNMVVGQGPPSAVGYRGSRVVSAYAGKGNERSSQIGTAAILPTASGTIADGGGVIK